MGLPVFWTSASSDPPWNFKIWFDQFLLAATVKEKLNPEILLEEPIAVIEEPLPRPETPGTNEDAQAVTDMETRDRLIGDEVILENEDRRERGPKVRHTYFITKYRSDSPLDFFWHWVLRVKRSLFKKTRALKYQNLNSGRWRDWQKYRSKKQRTSRMSNIGYSQDHKRMEKRWNRFMQH